MSIPRACVLLFSLVLALPMLALGGCSQITKPSAEFAGVKLQGLTTTDATLLFDVKVGNPYPVEMPLLNLGYSLASGDKPVLSGMAKDLPAIPAQSSKNVQVPVKLNYAALMKAVSGLKLGGVMPYSAALDLSATAPMVGEIKLPQVKHDGNVPIPAPPEVSLAGAPSWDKFGLSELEGTVPVRVKNTNSFKVDVNRLDVTLMVGDTLIGQAGVNNAGSLEPGATLDVPVKASFKPQSLSFSMLSALRDSSKIKLTGVMALNTPYAPIEMSFGK